MSFFEYYFDNVTGTEGEAAVCCPFPHHTANGVEYFEQHPSAHVNLNKGVFHCKACSAGHSEVGFIKEIHNCTYADAVKLSRLFNADDSSVFTWDDHVTPTELTIPFAERYGITKDTVEELHAVSYNSNEITIPIFMYDKLIDIRRYAPEEKPKVTSLRNTMTGAILPFDAWRATPKDRTTLICAGEKDMAVARSNGFNAITIIGGEQTLPITMNEFKDRTVAIVYDHDDAGITGARKLGAKLKEVCKSVKVVTGFHEICKEEKEDITDFFNKYQKTKADLIKYIETTEEFVPTYEEKPNCYPLVTLLEAATPKNVGRMLSSNIQVVATSEESYIAPTMIMATKTEPPADGEKMQAGEIKEWNLEERNVQDILHLIDSKFKEKTIEENVRSLMHILNKERYVRFQTLAKETIFKCYVTDMFETANTETLPMEFTAYSIGFKLDSGKKYLASYKLVPHPYQGQQLIMIITQASQSADSVSNFKIDETAKTNLDIIKNLPGTVSEKMHKLTEKFKGILGYDGNNTLIQAIDLAYNTPLEFNFGSFKNVRASIDTLIVGESRTGKSSTAEMLRTTYNLGTFTSLAGTSATIPGLVGGSNKVNGAYQTKAGLIPQNHRGLIIFEEFGKSHTNIAAELTDIRSSGEVRITRVAGVLTLPALVRMITLSNVKSSDGAIKPIASYPNGIEIITELIGTAEDIARYDMLVVLADKGANQIDPFWEPQEPFALDVYRTKIRWVWSRKADQVIIDKTVGKYIIDQANALNQKYDCHIKIFGTEAWKKISRIATAAAGCLISTDETYQNIIVKQEHVDFAVEYFKTLYDNSTFKLKEYVEHERRYATIDDNGVAVLQDIYTQHPALILHLEQVAKTSKNMLQAATGLSNDDYNAVMKRIVSGLFVRFHNHDIVPTERFRLGTSKIVRTTKVRKLGEMM